MLKRAGDYAVVVRIKDIQIHLFNLFLKDFRSTIANVAETKSATAAVIPIFFDTSCHQNDPKQDYEWIYVFHHYSVCL